MSKLYTEEQVRKAIALGYDWCHQKHIPDDFMIDNFIHSLTPIQLPTDEEISNNSPFKNAIDYTKEEYYNFMNGAKWMRDRVGEQGSRRIG